MSTQKRTLSELIDATDPAWSLVREWIAAAYHSVEVLERDPVQSDQTLLQLQVTTHSVLGAVAWETGGMLIDRGWLRLLGSGNLRMRGGLLSWNGMGEDGLADPLGGALIVAHDAIGGFFAINGGAFSDQRGNIFYFAPDSLHWEDLGKPYSAFVQWTMQGDLKGFYGMCDGRVGRNRSGASQAIRVSHTIRHYGHWANVFQNAPVAPCR